MIKKLGLSEPQLKLLYALLFSMGICLALYAGRVIAGNSVRYGFMAWNLILAWLPLAFAWYLGLALKKWRWSSWRCILLTLLWLGFLPNSFYVLSDLIHLRATGEVGLLYDVVVLASFIFNAFIVGFLSVYIVHRLLIRRLPARAAHSLIALVLLVCSFAIYLGRYLRWNTWDILVNPAGILFDVSDRVVNPGAHPRTFTTTASFFILIGSLYAVWWYAAAALKQPERKQ